MALAHYFSDPGYGLLGLEILINTPGFSNDVQIDFYRIYGTADFFTKHDAEDTHHYPPTYVEIPCFVGAAAAIVKIIDKYPGLLNQQKKQELLNQARKILIEESENQKKIMSRDPLTQVGSGLETSWEHQGEDYYKAQAVVNEITKLLTLLAKAAESSASPKDSSAETTDKIWKAADAVQKLVDMGSKPDIAPKSVAVTEIIPDPSYARAIAVSATNILKKKKSLNQVLLDEVDGKLYFSFQQVGGAFGMENPSQRKQRILQTAKTAVGQSPVPTGGIDVRDIKVGVSANSLPVELPGIGPDFFQHYNLKIIKREEIGQ
jgi:hypothetical protein